MVRELIEKKPFIARFTVGWVLARILHYGISIVEKQKQYQIAVLYLRVLLSTRYCPGIILYFIIFILFYILYLLYLFLYFFMYFLFYSFFYIILLFFFSL